MREFRVHVGLDSGVHNKVFFEPGKSCETTRKLQIIQEYLHYDFPTISACFCYYMVGKTGFSSILVPFSCTFFFSRDGSLTCPHHLL
jgi:hypothetical protein